MTTKQDLTDGLRVVLREGQRVMAGFGPEDWKKKVLDEGGTWTRKQAYCHLTSIAEVTPGLVGGLANSGGADVAANMDIDAFNAQMVSSKDSMSEADLQEAFKTGFEKLITFVEGLPDEQLQAPAKFGQLEGKVSEIMDGVLILHGMAHIYGAGGSPLG